MAVVNNVIGVRWQLQPEPIRAPCGVMLSGVGELWTVEPGCAILARHRRGVPPRHSVRPSHPRISGLTPANVWENQHRHRGPILTFTNPNTTRSPLVQTQLSSTRTTQRPHPACACFSNSTAAPTKPAKDTTDPRRTTHDTIPRYDALLGGPRAHRRPLPAPRTASGASPPTESSIRHGGPAIWPRVRGYAVALDPGIVFAGEASTSTAATSPRRTNQHPRTVVRSHRTTPRAYRPGH